MLLKKLQILMGEVVTLTERVRTILPLDLNMQRSIQSNVLKDIQDNPTC